MKKRQLASITLAALLLAGCGASASTTAESASAAASTVETAPATTEAPAEEPAALPDGVYTAEFKTDSSMFHASEAVDGMGTLTVENGVMTFHVSLQSQKIVNLYLGMAADAPDHESDWLQPTVDTVTYSDGTSDEVYGFDIPVAATVESPAALTVADGAMTATIVWSSPNYDYMLIDGEKYLPTNTEGNSTFEIPVTALDTALAVTADTVAMSTPHEIDYTLTFDSATLTAAE